MEPNQGPKNDPYPAAHPSDETLELYALGRLDESEVEIVEIHLLTCTTCQDTLTETDQYVGAMKGALEERAGKAAGSPKTERAEKASGAGAGSAREDSDGASFAWWRRLHPLTAFTMAAATLSIVAVVAYQSNSGAGSDAPTSLVLRAERGGAAGQSAEGQANAPLALEIQSDELNVDGTYGVRIVNVSGGEEWRGSPSVENGKAVAHVEPGLDPGQYWVRLYDPSDTLLKEYGLSVR